MKTSTINTAQVPNVAPAYNGADRNAWIFGWNPQQELWNGRLAMLGFVAYLLWDLAGYSILRDVLHLIG
ncbi:MULTISPECIES: chlorophyll a/b-binding protein [Calothrix]|uniref:High light inducible protein n=2 Tax=Calothrix TaxID=1186 RepID=A0ABR8APX5_9CYAN|nr:MULTISPECIES: chlorophyll a/b-binding protein [Calothrix]MBD2200647.1 high light inducible protein [Calothrix parietina FACHB-288]MBD2229704.1 high light inducible protein [Calothrix anomala FACHB-343]